MPPASQGLAAIGSLISPLLGLAAESITSRLDFTALLHQRGRLLQMQTALPTLALVPERAVMREAVSQPFELTVDALASSAHFELKRLIGEQMTLSLLQPDGGYKPWHGYVTEAAQLGADGGLARYRLVMRPWLHFLALRRDCFVYQDRDARAIFEDVFADHPQANFRFEISEPLRERSLCVQYRESDLAFVSRLLAEEGLSYHFEHDATGASLDSAKNALHTLVISDRRAARPEHGTVRFTSQHPTANLEGQRDAVTHFAAMRRLQPNSVTLASWNYKQLAGTSAEISSALDIGELPALEVYDGTGAYRYQDAPHAERAAELALQALELDFKRFEGQGSTRHFEAGRRFQLVDHPLYGSGLASGLVSHPRADNQFTLLAIEHHMANNFGAQAAKLLGLSALERGTYRNHFHAAPAAAVIVPRFVRKPTAPGLQTALVVGVPGEPLSTEREHRVKIQFGWQRGEQPLAGGLAHDATSPDTEGNAPGNQTSGTWVRVASPAAGANWGAIFTPRIGTEVAVQFVEGDIDRPLIVGSLYNGQDLPPYSAGVDSGVNHPGVLSGLHSHALDGAGYNQWVIDDATGQLRMRLLCSYTLAEVGLGHLIQQSAGSAQRGSWRGAGFELATQAWISLRAAKGLLISTSARGGSYGSARSTQMDADEATAKLKAARELGQSLTAAARHAQAHGLSTHDGGQAMQRTTDAIDPQQRGKHEGAVGGQAAQQADAARTLSDPVHAFADPLAVLDSAAGTAFTSEAQIATMSGQNLSVTAHGDVQQTAAHTYASVSGRTTSLYAHEGGIKAFAANGPVSIRAHTDAMQLLADQELTVISVNDQIHIDAKNRIELRDGESSIVLEGGDITFTMPGLFSAPMSTHEFMAPGQGTPDLPNLPSPEKAEHWVELNYRDVAAVPMAGADYTLRFASGVIIKGQLDGQGFARIDGVPYEPYTVKLGESSEAPKPRHERTPNPFFGGGPATGTEEALQRLQAFSEMEMAALQDDFFPDEIAAMTGDVTEVGGSRSEEVELYVDDYRTESPSEQALNYEDYRAEHPEGKEGQG
ncbi:type VI secretion system tip protein VgrG [Aquincola sp. S2]|uniref:Type VI secretion system tip protein VgrG n=1 Tax=Pseudaquabacterium terrae TaxID=2732868 RepID=A0ABX2ELC0_9BURK|nr:type VI secretion system Vgr family protein [Aquabacterium terrae]NRF69454.1 type VI secretion system tip protein VgrG [Aquabacterium terrae]